MLHSRMLARCIQAPPWKAALVVALALAAAHVRPASATSLRPLTPAQVTELAARIVEGRCVSVREVTLPGFAYPATEYVFAVDHVLKGEGLAEALGASQRRLVVRQAGSIQPDGRSLGIPGLPSYSVGKRYRLALNGDSSLGLTSPVGFGQGVMRLPDLPTAAAGAKPRE